MGIKTIARRLAISKNTVRRALSLHEPPRYERARKGSIVDAVEPQVRALLAEFPDMPSTVIMERIGWTRGKTVLFGRIQQLQPLFIPPDPASRTEYQPGELAQCDLWFPPVDVPLGFGQTGRPPVLVMVCGYSRVMTARMIPSRQAPDLLAGHWSLITGLGRVPRKLVWDNESAVGQWRGGKPVLTESMNAFRGTLGISVIQCRPGDPEAKGLVERANGYLETSFLPGRRFGSPAEFNLQLEQWLVRANQRQHRRLGCRPVDRWDADRAGMLELPPVAPIAGWRLATRLPRDHYVRLDSNDYSVHPVAVGRRVEVAADLDLVRVSCGGQVVACHARCWADHQSITDPEHARAAAAARQARQQRASRPTETLVEHRDLADYDRLLNLDADTSVAEDGEVA
jgi:transposase